MEELSMDSTTLTRQMKLQQWAEIIQTRMESGLTVAKWCEQNSVNPAKYYYWLKRIRQMACDNLPAVKAQTSNIVPIETHQLITETQHIDQSFAMRVSVSGITLEFTNAASAELIENSIMVLSHVR